MLINFMDQFLKIKSSNNSFIYETIAYIFQNPKSDFDDKHGRRDIILVSDLMQHSERLSFTKLVMHLLQMQNVLNLIFL